MCYTKNPLLFVVFLFFLVSASSCMAQELYTARGYWEESTRENYRKVKQKQVNGDSLTANENSYLTDFEAYLLLYYQKLSPEEVQKYELMKKEWDRELIIPQAQTASAEEFEWRNRDRFLNALYGTWYGTSLVIITEIDNAGALGIPLITGGAWLLGPVVNPKKYEGINQSTIRASNTGKILGLIYGASLGLTIAAEADNSGQVIAGLSTVGSIALGEIGFQMQKKRNFSDGRIEMVRHYGFLGPWVGLSGASATEVESANLAGATMVAGGIVGLLIGNKVARKYDYSRGDVDAISTLTLISTGIGFAFVAEAFDSDGSGSLILIPAAASVLGTIWGQRAVRGAYLTRKQGSTINLATAGSALVGLGILSLTESTGATVWFGVTSGLALIAHQIVFNKYKKENLVKSFQGRSRKHDYQFSMNIMPENYFVNQRIHAHHYSPEAYSQRMNPLVKVKLKF